MQNMFVVIEGLDGCGKDTQIDMVVDNLDNFVTYRNLSDYALGRGIRGMIGSKDEVVNKFMHNHMGVAHMYLSELFFVQEQIKEALVNNNVICSRWHYSTMAYIGDSKEVIDFIGNSSTKLIKPNLVIRLKLDLEECLNRIDTRNESKEFFETKAKLESTNNRYNNLDYMYEPFDNHNIYNLDVNGLSKDEVHNKIKEVIDNYKDFIFGYKDLTNKD